MSAKSQFHSDSLTGLQHVSDMIAGVAHELNNSVGIVLGYVQLLKLRNRDESMTEGLDRIEKSIIHSARLIRRLQEYNITTGGTTSTIVDLSTIIDSVFNSDEADWRGTASEKELNISVSITDKDIFVHAEPKDLVTAISQLLRNSVEHSLMGGAIRIDVTMSGDLVRVSVIDQGKGIPEDLKHKIYEPFFSTKGTRGAGLGLTVVQSIISRQGGRVGFKNNDSGGTTFTVTLPLKRKIADRSSGDWINSDHYKANVLIVDDDEEICNVLSDMLTIEGFQPMVCQDAYCAMKALEKNKYRLMITDLSMPGMSGLELAAHVREKFPDIEIVLLTGWGNRLLSDGKEMEGIKAVLPKPFRLQDVLKLVRDD